MKCIAIVGPTASGKTALSIALAKRLGGEILSCDSMQIYRGMDIGTAKATPEEQAACPHHLLDLADPDTPFSAADYADAAMVALRDIHARGRLPIFCGGTGLYLDAVRTLRHKGEAPAPDPALRERLQEEAKTEEGQRRLWETLREIDPEAAEATHYHNVRRVTRALEIFYTTGKTKTEIDRAASRKNPEVEMLIFGLRFVSRATLYARIDKRVDLMMEQGLLEETKRLLALGALDEGGTAAQAIGYKELLGYLRGEHSLEEATTQLKTASRRYAKRQMTYFGREPAIHWITIDMGDTIRDTDSLLQELLPQIDTFLST